MPNYKLINPRIEGSLETSFQGNNIMSIAKRVWEDVSQYITNNVPKFAFTLENSQTGKLHHFCVKEQLKGGSSAKYNISEISVKLNDKQLKEFKNKSQKAGMKGGKKDKDKDDDDDDSSTSSDDVFSAIQLHNLYSRSQPIVYWWYDPWIYGFESIFMPTLYLTPYIEIVSYGYYNNII